MQKQDAINLFVKQLSDSGADINAVRLALKKACDKLEKQNAERRALTRRPA